MPRAAAHTYGGFQDSSLNVSPATKSSTGQQIRREIAFKKNRNEIDFGPSQLLRILHLSDGPALNNTYTYY